MSLLRDTFEALPRTCKHGFAPGTRAQMLAALYDAFWGNHAGLFLPADAQGSGTMYSATSVDIALGTALPALPMSQMLAEYQRRINFCGAAEEEPTIPGRPCGRIFNKGESCFRCKCVHLNALFDTS
jgi:E3 ubiquitin-protein ligase UBR1